MKPETNSGGVESAAILEVIDNKKSDICPLILNTIGGTIITKLVMFSITFIGEQQWLSQKL